MMTKLPSGDSTEEMRREFKEVLSKAIEEGTARQSVGYQSDLEEFSWIIYQAAIATKQSKIEGLQAAARFWQDKAGDISEELNVIAITEFSGDYPPTFRQGLPVHELEELVTAKRCLDMVALIAQANATIAALQAKIEEADGQEPFSVLRCDSLALEPTPLFTRPPRQSERELELLAVIKQMREFISLVKETGFMRDEAQEALALTPDMAAPN